MIFSCFSTLVQNNCIPLINLRTATCLALFQFYMALPASAAVLPGIDVLSEHNFELLQGKRVGLITNQTGRTSSGASSIDILQHAPGVSLVALYSPEHGIRGGVDDKMDSAIDQKSGLPVHSLYGTTCRPTAEMLHGV